MSVVSEPYNVDGDPTGARPVPVSPVPGRLAQPAVALLESENVIKRAIEMVGVNTMRPEEAGTFIRLVSVITMLPELFRVDTPLDEAYVSVKKALKVRQEGVSDIISIAFRHRDPKLAVVFTNALINVFTARYLELYRNSNDSVSFFLGQKKENRAALAKASAALQEFASANRVFKIDDQIRLLLGERSHQASDLAKTTGLIIEKEKEALTIPTQLSQMRPINRLPQITGLTLPKTNKEEPKHVEDAPTAERLALDPPLLLVRVYQETIATLVRLQTELAGLRALELHQKNALKKFDEELGSIMSKEAQFYQLQQEVIDLKAKDEAFTRKLTELQVSQDLKAKNSRVCR